MRRIKIITGYNIDKLEERFNDYMKQVDEELGEGVSVSYWVEIAEEGRGVRPLNKIHMFIFVEQYMTKEEYEKDEEKRRKKS